MKKITKLNICLALFVFVNALFLFKYLERYTSYYVFLTCIGIIIYSFLFKANMSYLKIERWQKIVFPFFILYLILSLVLLTQIPVQSLNVDRWSVITSFWDSFFNLDYAYKAVSHMGNPPGPMPMYFILNLPFYLIGETGLFSVFGLYVFYLILKKRGLNYSKPILLTLLSVFTLWEIATRSNIFANAVIILGLILYLLNTTFTKKNTLIMGLLTGLALSTRNVFVIPVIITLLFLFRNKQIDFKKLVLFGSASIAAFILTFAPFVIGHFEDFLQVNPFVIQSSGLMPFYLSFSFILVGIYFGLKSKSKNEVIYYSAINLFITILGYFMYCIVVDGFTNAFWKSTADISYFIMCIPFLLVFCAQKKSLVSNEI